MFQLSSEEFENLKSQFVTSSWGGVRKLPFAFTELGVSMLSSVLKSPIAIEISVKIIRAFVELRQQVSAHPEYALLREMVKRIEAEYKMVRSEQQRSRAEQESAKMTQLVDTRLLTDKVTQLRHKVNTMSAILDEFQDTHLIIKRPT